MEYLGLALACRNFLDTMLQSSDDSDSDDDDLMNCLCNDERGKIIRVQNYAENLIPLMTDQTFKDHFRMKRETVQYLVNLIGGDLHEADGDAGRVPIAVEKQILVSLWMMATPDSYRSVCDRFDIGKSSAWRIVWKFVNALYQHLSTFIKWPTNAEALATSVYIQNKYQFPGVIGAVDGTHVRITAPSVNAHNYINRKGFYSIQTQVVCDHNLKFIHIYSGEVGSVHDSRVFRLSGLQDLCIPANFPQDSHLLGDKAYALQQHVMVPYRDNHHLDNATIRYNTIHSSARMMVERSIGLLKGRFRSLLDKLPFRRTDLIPYYISACCILHNICIQQDDLINIPMVANNNGAFPAPVPQAMNNVMRINGFNKRERIKNAL